MNRALTTSIALASGGLLAAGALLTAGPLDPPAGPVEPTFKTLAQVEPRTPVGAAGAPGDAASTFRITQPGSYYLTGNILGEPGKHAIAIAADRVTLDLNGFTLDGQGVGEIGVFVDPARTSVVVRNGTVRAWTETGVACSSGRSVVEDLVADANGHLGVHLGIGSVARRITAGANQRDGIAVDAECQIIQCSAQGNAEAGFRLSGRSQILDSHAGRNTGPGVVAAGDCTVSRCAANNNTDVGVRAGVGSRIHDCTVVSNDRGGIVASFHCTIVGNTCTTNAGDGNIVASSGSRIENNHVASGSFGLHVTGAGNFIARNTVRACTTNYSVAAGNAIGPLLGPAAITSSNSYANFDL